MWCDVICSGPTDTSCSSRVLVHLLCCQERDRVTLWPRGRCTRLHLAPSLAAAWPDHCLPSTSLTAAATGSVRRCRRRCSPSPWPCCSHTSSVSRVDMSSKTDGKKKKKKLFFFFACICLRIWPLKKKVSVEEENVAGDEGGGEGGERGGGGGSRGRLINYLKKKGIDKKYRRKLEQQLKKHRGCYGNEGWSGVEVQKKKKTKDKRQGASEKGNQ